jgi:hypothetical protein
VRSKIVSPEILFPRARYLAVPIVCLRGIGFHHVYFDLRGADIPTIYKKENLHKTELRTEKFWTRY